MRILDGDLPITATDPNAPMIAFERLRWAGPLTIITSLAAVHLVRVLVIHIPGVRAQSMALGWIAPTADTVILVTIAVGVFAYLSAFSDRPVRAWRHVAFGALLMSFLPLLMMGRGPLFGNAVSAVAVGLMHVAAYVPCVTLLPWLSVERLKVGVSS